MSEAADPDVASYASFNDFFTRPLRAAEANRRRSMAKKRVAAIVKIQIPAGKATPAPPVGTASS